MPDFYIANTTTATVSCDGMVWANNEVIPYLCECHGAWIDTIRRSSKIWTKFQDGTLELRGPDGSPIPPVTAEGVRIQQSFEFLVKSDSPGTTSEACVPMVVAAPLLAGQPLVQKPTGEVCPATNTTKEGSSVVGLASVSAVAGDILQVCCGGMICLPTEDWDTVTGQTGGLTPNQSYWLDATGGLTSTRPTTGWLMRVGRSVSSDCLCFTPDSDPCRLRIP